MQTTLALKEIYKPVEADLEAVRANIRELWADALRLVHGDNSPPFPVSGKMLRPAMSLLSAAAIGGTDTSKFVPLATAMELLHLAALAHDDVIDGANLRHGARSLNAMWDNHAAVLGGDYLVARAIDIMGVYNSYKVIANAIRSVREMAEGELTYFGRGNEDFSPEACISLARQKTASLFAVACSTPACLIQGDAHAELHAYGLAFGIAFQLIDDLLDLSQNPETLGKPALADIVEGKKTLPIIYMREVLDGAGKIRFDRLKGRALSSDDRAWIADLLESSGARDKTETLAREYADDARSAIAGLSASPYREALLNLTEFVVARAS
jgi:octaprenyl-diphosphate synthase